MTNYSIDRLRLILKGFHKNYLLYSKLTLKQILAFDKIAHSFQKIEDALTRSFTLTYRMDSFLSETIFSSLEKIETSFMSSSIFTEEVKNLLGDIRVLKNQIREQLLPPPRPTLH